MGRFFVCGLAARRTRYGAEAPEARGNSDWQRAKRAGTKALGARKAQRCAKHSVFRLVMLEVQGSQRFPTFKRCSRPLEAASMHSVEAKPARLLNDMQVGMALEPCPVVQSRKTRSSLPEDRCVSENVRFYAVPLVFDCMERSCANPGRQHVSGQRYLFGFARQ